MAERERTKEELKIEELVDDAVRRFRTTEKDRDSRRYDLDQAAFDVLLSHPNDPYHLLSVMFYFTELKPSDAYDLDEAYQKDNLGSFVPPQGEESWENLTRAFLTPLLVAEMVKRNPSLEHEEMKRHKIKSTRKGVKNA